MNTRGSRHHCLVKRSRIRRNGTRTAPRNSAPPPDSARPPVSGWHTDATGSNDKQALRQVRCDVDDPRLELDLDPIPRAAAEARQEVKAWLMGVRAPVGCLDDVLLIVSELVTNAVLHARTPLRLV